MGLLKSQGVDPGQQTVACGPAPVTCISFYIVYTFTLQQQSCVKSNCMAHEAYRIYCPIPSEESVLTPGIQHCLCGL